jgi:hypothetical protein
MNPNENQNIVPDPNPNVVTNSETPTSSVTQPSVSSPAPVVPQATKSHKKTIITVILILVIFIGGGGAFALYHHNHKAKTVSSTVRTSTPAKPSASTTTPTNNGLLTYVSTDNSSLIVTDNSQKQLAKITNPAGNQGFDVLSNNGQDALIAAQTSSGNNEPEYLVDYTGKVTDLPTSVSSPSVAGTSAGYQFLGYNNDYIENSCTSDSQGDSLTCDIDDVNLKTGAVAVVTSSANSTPTEDPSLSILGVTTGNLAYILSDGGNTGGSEKASLEEVNISNKQVVKTISLPDLLSPTNDQPYIAIANDFSSLAYVGTATSDSQIDITNLANSTTSIINDQCSGLTATVNGIHWSPDNSKIAYDCDGGTATFVAYINVASKGVTQLKSMSVSSPHQTTFNDEGWSSDATTNYYYSSGNSTTPSTWTYYSADTTSGGINSSPTPTGYWLVTSQGL